MIRLVVYAIVGASLGAAVFYFLADSLPEGAIAGALIGACLGVLVAMRAGAGASSPSFEYEAAGIHDDNLVTTARRNLVREAYRESLHARETAEFVPHNEEERGAKVSKRQ